MLIMVLCYAGGYEILKGKLPEFVVPDLKGFAVKQRTFISCLAWCDCIIPALTPLTVIQLKPYVSREATPKPQ